MKKVQATARVKLIVEVTVGTWGDDCTMKQVFDQAAESAVGRLRNFLQREHDIRICGQPTVGVVVFDHETATTPALPG